MSRSRANGDTMVQVIAAGTAPDIGFVTPIAAGMSALINISLNSQLSLRIGARCASDLETTEAVATTVALAIVGAGAHSLDAYLFGRGNHYS